MLLKWLDGYSYLKINNYENKFNNRELKMELIIGLLLIVGIMHGEIMDDSKLLEGWMNAVLKDQ